MKKLIFALIITMLGFEVPAAASEFQEQAMCSAVSPTAAFPRISIQTEPSNVKRAILILTASDGWTQVYSGPIVQNAASLNFREDKRTISAVFSKLNLAAHMSFNNDDYVCDTRSFGH